MNAWTDFLDGLFPSPDKPGEVMICFMNRYLEGLDGIKYKIKYDGMEKAGVTTGSDYCITLAPKSFKPIQTFVWSRTALTYKQLDDVVPEVGKKKLVRKVMKTVKTTGNPKQLTKNDDNPAPVTPAAGVVGPSPVGNQGQIQNDSKNENGQAQATPLRPVPGEITKEQLRKIFPKNKGGVPNDAHLQAVADELNADLAKYKLDTPVRRAHFFGQIKRESPQFTGAPEDLNYTPAGLIATFGYYSNKKHRKEAQDDGRLEQKLPNGKKKILRKPNEIVIANKVYMGPDGNRYLGNTQPGDGWRFRGRGMKQTTGRSNYRDFTETHPSYWGGNIDFVENPELVAKMPYTLRSALVYWLIHNCWKKADGGMNDAAIDAVTKIINGGEITKHKAGQYTDPNKNPVLLRRKNVYLAYAALI